MLIELHNIAINYIHIKIFSSFTQGLHTNSGTVHPFKMASKYGTTLIRSPIDPPPLKKKQKQNKTTTTTTKKTKVCCYSWGGVGRTWRRGSSAPAVSSSRHNKSHNGIIALGQTGAFSRAMNYLYTSR